MSGVDVERQALPAVTNADAVNSASPHKTGDRAREVFRHFLHPNGKKVHVAQSPEEAERLRNDLRRNSNVEDFDVVLSGTQEHLETLRLAQNHHENHQNELREKHKDVYDHITSVNHNLAAIADELKRVGTNGVSLDAHFGRFGYDAHVRSYDEDPSAARSISGASSESSSPAYERGFATTLKLFKTPVVRQYFHKGILWRASGAQEVQSFELFIDLLFVGIIAVIGDVTSEDPTAVSLLRFVITFTLSWKIWNDMALFISWFETDDVFQRVSVLFLLICLFGYTTNITHAFEEESTYATLIGFYLAARIFMASYLLLISWLIPMVRSVMIYHAIAIFIAAALWIGSVHVEYPNQLALIWIAMFIEVTGSVSHVFVKSMLTKIAPSAGRWMEKKFEFYPAINIEHRTERTNAFVGLVFGYTVVAILFQSVTNGIDAFFGKAVLGLIQCFIFNWLYFEVDGSNLSKHAIRRSKTSAFAWSLAHLPFIMAFILAGGALARLVVAHDCPDTGLERLTETYQERSEGEIPGGIRWFYSAGLGTALIMMMTISISHVHKEVDGLRLPKKFRLVARLAVACVMVLLPLAENLNSLELIGIVTALLVFLLILELWATSSCNDRIFGRATQCRYVGRTSRRNVEALTRDEKGGVDIDQLEVDEEKESGTTICP